MSFVVKDAFDQWKEAFKPLSAFKDLGGPYAEFLHDSIPLKFPISQVWSLVENDDGDFSICPGKRMVNFQGYLLTLGFWASDQKDISLSETVGLEHARIRSLDWAQEVLKVVPSDLQILKLNDYIQ